MRSDQLYALSVLLESEGLTGSGDKPLETDDIFSLLHFLQDRGVDLSPLEAKPDRSLLKSVKKQSP